MMNQGHYTYHIRIANRKTVQVEKSDPENNVLGEPSGYFGYRGKCKKRIQALHQAGRSGRLRKNEVRELGETLFTTLLDDSLRLHFFSLYEQARREDKALRIELDVDEGQLPDVAALPWEFMRVPFKEGVGTLWLSTAPHLVFSRRRARWIAPEPIQLQAGERLRIAVVVSAPDGLGVVRYEKIWQALQKLADKAPHFELLEMVNPATTASIDEILEQKPHIFHFIGHAQLEDENEQETGQIALVDDIFNDALWIGAERFSELFTRHQPGVVVLQACEGGALSASNAFVGVASQVVQQNIPVVVAMQYEVSNVTAQRFALEFYKRLGQNKPVDKAAQEGRRRIALGPLGYSKRDFATPVLFMRVRDGHLFQRSAESRSEAANVTLKKSNVTPNVRPNVRPNVTPNVTLNKPRIIMNQLDLTAAAPLASSISSRPTSQVESMIEEKTAGFVGREYVFGAIDHFLATQRNGYFTIEGDSGVGKSAILAEYVKRTGCVAYFNMRSQGINSTTQFLNTICTDLIVRYGLPYPSLPADAVQDGAFFAQLLREATMRLPPQERLVIAIDALDEVDLVGHPSGVNTLYLPPSLPERVYFIVTRQPVFVPWTVYAPHYLLDLSKHQIESQQDVQTYLQRRSHHVRQWMNQQQVTSSQFVHTLANKSQNNFMYLRHILADIELGFYQNTSLHQLPTGLMGYYEDHWLRMGMCNKPLPHRKIKIIYLLAEVREPVSRSLMAEFADVNQLMTQEVLNEWSAFLYEQRVEMQTRYSLYHNSFRDFLHRPDVIRAAGVTISGINALIANNLWGKLFGH